VHGYYSVLHIVATPILAGRTLSLGKLNMIHVVHANDVACILVGM